MPVPVSMTSARVSVTRRTARLLALLAALSTAQRAHATRDDTPHAFQIERASLDHVLLEIAQVGGLHISFASGICKGHLVGPINGTMSAKEAAGRALQDTELTLMVLPDGTLTILEADGSTPRTAVATLPPTEVYGTTDPSLAVFSTSNVTRVEMPMMSVPHAVNTISNALLSSQLPPSLGAALSQSGVEPVATQPSAPPQYAVRGFMTETISIDGLPDKLASQRPVESMDEITVIKGPNADVAGFTMAGGAVNANLKAPSATARNSIAVEAGSHAERTVVADLGGPIGADGLSYRAVGVQDTSANSEGGYAGHRVSYGHVALGWHSAAMDMTVGLESLSNRKPVQPFTFMLGGAPAQLPLQSPLGNPDDGVRNRADRLYYTVSHSLGGDWDDWAMHSRWAYENLSVRTVQWMLMPMLLGTERLPLLGADYRANNRLWALSNDLTGTIRQGWLTHSLVLGWDEIQDRQDFRYSGAVSVAMQNPFAPVPLPPVDSASASSALTAGFAPGASLSQTVRQSVFRLRDRIAIGERWEVSGSIRANDYAAKLANTQFHGLAWTPAFGVTYRLDARTAWFADVARGVQINTGFFYSGGAVEPERSRQLETGLRWEDRNRGLTAQAALYRIEADHVSLADTSRPGYYTQIAGQTSHGIELSLQGTLARGWETSLWLAFAHMDGTPSDDIPLRMPAVRGSAWTTYTMQGGTLDGMGAGLGVGGQSRITTSYAGAPFRWPGYVLIDGSLFWHRKQWRVDLISRNVFNARAYGSTLSSAFIPVLPGRTLAVRLTRNF